LIVQIYKNSMKNINKNLIFLLIIIAVFSFGVKNTRAEYMNVNTSYTSQGIAEATLSGVVNPGGYTTTAWFEYATESNFTNYKETSHKFIGSQNLDYPISMTITDLRPDTIYYARIVADNGRSIIRGNVITFVTNPTITNTNTFVNNSVVRNTNTVTRNQVVYVEAPIQKQEVVYVKAPVQTQHVTYVEVPQNQVYTNSYTYDRNINANLNTKISTVSDYNNNYNNYNPSLTANTIFTNSFLPNNLFGWLILILIVASIIAVLRRIII